MRFLFFIFVVPFISLAQVNNQSGIRSTEDTLIVPAVQPVVQADPVAEIFRKVEQGLQTASVDMFAGEFSVVVSITIGSGVRGYYSGNQAASILSAYISERRLISFEFSQIHETGSLPYATGRLVYIQKGVQESTQVYVSLTKQHSLWVITQFNIY
jgi:hypothetical protein